MELNWKRGLTRLYCVFWGLWILFIGIRILVATPQILFGSIPSVAIFWFVVLAFAIPALLYFALRWAIRGYLANGA